MTPLQEEMKKKKIIEQFTWDDSVNANDIHVEVIDDTVRLSGTVPNYTARLAAGRDAYIVEGIRNVENFVEVRFPPTVTVPPDHELKENIEKMLLWNSNLDTTDVHVEVKQGEVTLSGSVSSYWMKELAGNIASSATGVIKINNDLSVSVKRSYRDRDIEKEIKNAFERNGLIDHEKILVEVSNGIVQLSGTVKALVIKKEAVNIALHTKGVKQVKDNLLIG